MPTPLVPLQWRGFLAVPFRESTREAGERVLTPQSLTLFVPASHAGRAPRSVTVRANNALTPVTARQRLSTVGRTRCSTLQGRQGAPRVPTPLVPLLGGGGAQRKRAARGIRRGLLNFHMFCFLSYVPAFLVHYALPAQPKTSQILCFTISFMLARASVRYWRGSKWEGFSAKCFLIAAVKATRRSESILILQTAS